LYFLIIPNHTKYVNDDNYGFGSYFCGLWFLAFFLSQPQPPQPQLNHNQRSGKKTATIMQAAVMRFPFFANLRRKDNHNETANRTSGNALHLGFNDRYSLILYTDSSV